jgi:hypothetical protein
MPEDQVGASKAQLDAITKSLMAHMSTPQPGGMQVPTTRASEGEVTPQGYNMSAGSSKMQETGIALQNFGSFVHNMVAQHKQNQIRDAMSEWQGFNHALTNAQALAGDPADPSYQDKVKQMLSQDPWVKANLDPANPKAQKRLKNMYKALNVDLLEGNKENVHRQGLMQFFKVEKAMQKVKQAGQAMIGHKQGQPQGGQSQQGQGGQGQQDEQAKQQMFKAGLDKLMAQQTFTIPTPEQRMEAARIAVEAQRAGMEKFEHRQGVDPATGKPAWFVLDKTNPNAPAKMVETVGADGKLTALNAAPNKSAGAGMGKVATIEGAPYGVMGPNGIITPSDPEFEKGVGSDADWYKRKMNEGNKAYALAESKKVELAGKRAETYNTSRHYAAINKETGFLEYPSATQMNQHPDMYAPVSGGMQAIQKEAVFGDIYYNIDNVQEAADALAKTPGGFSATSRLQMLTAMASNEPSKTLNTMISSGAMGTLNPAQADYLRAVASLSENAMSVRALISAGQGSEDMRNAIRAVVPFAGTPNIGYLKGQLKLFKGTVQRLEKGVPKVMIKPGAGPTQQEEKAPWE